GEEAQAHGTRGQTRKNHSRPLLQAQQGAAVVEKCLRRLKLNGLVQRLDRLVPLVLHLVRLCQVDVGWNQMRLERNGTLKVREGGSGFALRHPQCSTIDGKDVRGFQVRLVREEEGGSVEIGFRKGER